MRIRFFLGVLLSISALIPLALTTSAQAITPLHNVTFYENDSGSDVTNVVQQANTPTNLLQFSTLSFSNPNYVFAGWNTQQNGAGTNFTDGQSYSFSSDLSLYAKWVQVFHSVTFNENASPTDAIYKTQTANQPTPLTTVSNLGFSKSNYSFVAWNTQPDGSGTTYQDASSYSFVGALTLYAQWAPNTATLTFDLNGGSGSIASVTKSVGGSVTLPAGSNFTKSHYTFDGWNTMANGQGTSYAAGSNFPLTTNVTLYAQWTIDKVMLTLVCARPTLSNTYETVSTLDYGSARTLLAYNGCGEAGFAQSGWNTSPTGTGASYALGAMVTLTSDVTLYTVFAPVSAVVTFAIPGGPSRPSLTTEWGHNVVVTPPPARTGFTFAGWFSAPTGGTQLSHAGVVHVTSSVTLYAHYRGNPLVSLLMGDNGGIGRAVTQTVHEGLAVTVPSGDGLHRAGYSFKGWARSKSATTPSFRIGQRLFLHSSLEIYAVWRQIPSAHAALTYLVGVGVFPANSSSLSPALRHDVAALADLVVKQNRTVVDLYGYATSADRGAGSALLALQRALAVKKELDADLVARNDIGVLVHAAGEGRLSNPVLATFRKVEVFAN